MDSIKLFGIPLNLRPHDIGDEPRCSAFVGYVQREGECKVVRSIWQDGAWRDDRGKPLGGKLVRWFDLEPPNAER